MDAHQKAIIDYRNRSQKLGIPLYYTVDSVSVFLRDTDINHIVGLEVPEIIVLQNTFCELSKKLDFFAKNILLGRLLDFLSFHGFGVFEELFSSINRTFEVETVVEVIGGLENIVHDHKIISVFFPIIFHCKGVETVVSSKERLWAFLKMLVVGDQDTFEEFKFFLHNCLQKILS